MSGTGKFWAETANERVSVGDGNYVRHIILAACKVEHVTICEVIDFAIHLAERHGVVP